MRRGAALGLLGLRHVPCGVREGVPNPEQERGVALLITLLFVAILALLAALLLDRLIFSSRLAGRVAMLDQARAAAMAAEQIALRRLSLYRTAGIGSGGRVDALLARDIVFTSSPDSANPTDSLDSESPDSSNAFDTQNQARDSGNLSGFGGIESIGLRLVGRLSDGQGCFNLNSLLAETRPQYWTQRGQAVTQFTNLLRLLDFPEQAARRIAATSADWLDSDRNDSAYGGEDLAYRVSAQPHLPANQPMADVSELRAVLNISRADYVRLRPWLCVLPETAPVQININQLPPEKAALVSMMSPQLLPLSAVRDALAARPQGGYRTLQDFWTRVGVASPSPQIAENLTLSSRWLWLTSSVYIGRDVQSGAPMSREPDVVAHSLIGLQSLGGVGAGTGLDTGLSTETSGDGNGDGLRLTPRLAMRRWGAEEH